MMFNLNLPPFPLLGSRWPSGNTLASDASGRVSTLGRGIFELDAGFYPSASAKFVATSKEWVTAVESYEGFCRR